MKELKQRAETNIVKKWIGWAKRGFLRDGWRAGEMVESASNVN